MDSGTRRKRKSSPRSVVKHLKCKHITLERVHELVDSAKGEAIQALYTIFGHSSILFETCASKNISLPGFFITFLNLQGYSFIGYGNNKTASRAAACKVALIFFLDNLHGNEFPNYNPVVQQLVINEDKAISLPSIIASLVLSKYEQLRNDSKEYIPWFKMIAGLVMVRDEDMKNVQVLALSTGNKCIESKNVRLDGSVIVDSHAETLIRRCFQYFLYSQLSSSHSENVIIEKNESKFRLKPKIRLYLYINSAPCGDSRIFTVSDKESSHDKHPNRMCRGVLRIKLDGSNSTVPLTNIEKYDLKRLMVMSCSDKLLKSNSLGLQGSLLSSFIEPIYLDGIIIGDSFRKSHLTRALYERIEGMNLPSPFRVHRPVIYGLEKTPKVISKSPKTCLNWVCGNAPEIINSLTGKTSSGHVSRLCKRTLFEKYLNLQTSPQIMYSYEDCKRECKEYQVAKTRFCDMLESKYLGRWIKRVPSFDAFTINKNSKLVDLI